MKRVTALVMAFALLGCTIATYGGPVPIGASDVTFSYPTASGTLVLQDSIGYGATGIWDAVPLGGNPSIRYFNSVNTFGRRILVNGAVRENESLLTHALFKEDGNTAPFFPGLIENGTVTLEVQNIHFTEPVLLQRDTVMVHAMWDADQSDLLPNFYFNVHNFHTGADPVRDDQDLFPLLFMDFPSPNYVQGDLVGAFGLEVLGDGTDTLGLRIELPYDMFRNLEESGQAVPPGLPAPFGFLEPFHFHLEYTVAPIPEPATLLIVLAGLPLLRRSRRR